ncbi:MAG TPA: TetR family transcriptional regulator [Bosea sp. (in: a-proteobacteria)]|jgi:AcrR family transcriptional regulator|uniref:TetR/AcrR family transcriptional regulator n=1 Tax=Bosea sp. (in: a-proteobacteria) TaxID=1871050 RepID=UPI002E0DB3E5|nr:TetR family transcriptional regulator [Bosea sp. (in: a-proteobacteria)]
MGRHRTIDREALLDAADTVVNRAGAAHLTLEAVAVEAGISKASVLYDYKTKRALIRAVIERRVSTEMARVQACVASIAPAPNAEILGRLAAASRSFSDEDRTVALSLCAALAHDAGLREPIQNAYRDQIDEVASRSTHPRGAMLAFLAAEGLMMMDRLGLHSWPQEERGRLLADIAWLVEQTPGPRDEPAR